MKAFNIYIAVTLAAIAGTAHAGNPVILDCRIKDGNKISSGKGAEIYKISENVGIYLWSDSSRLYAGGDRNWTKIEDSGYCNYNNDILSSNYSFGDEKYNFECESGYPYYRRKSHFSFDRIDGTLHAYATGLGGDSYIFNRSLQCGTISDPSQNPAPAPKF